MTSHLLNSIKGTINIVTGCGSGLGLATLKRLLDRGSSGIIGIDRNLADEFFGQIKNDDRLLLSEHDTQDEDAVKTTLELAVQKFGRLDNVINVAGVAATFSLINRNNSMPYGLSHINELLEFNTFGTFNISRLAIKYMMIDHQPMSQNNKTKCIVNVSCISTEDGQRGQSGYSASKGAIDAMTLEMARELAPYGIRSNTINVGYFDTKVIQASSPDLIEFLSKEVNLLPNRLGGPDEFAHLVQAILENQMLNGSCIRLDAGAHPDLFTKRLS